ncbi:hypothetical protein LshimejAT787_3900030 [Lyophyllum shimeji]|uniref:Uncharacterized protein n=1 Tax=Lyophyllum shimeji TaxID=47721 RepID=A0A9P3UV99_LYOSH|nr:hypothetical protein LshimejAT787_3900030 [Lyophyllum shimeji]
MIQVLSHCYGDYVEQHLTMELPRGATARMLFPDEGIPFQRQPRGPITMNHLRHLLFNLNLATPAHAAIWAAALTAFWGCRRLGELLLRSRSSFSPTRNVTRQAGFSHSIVNAHHVISFHLPWTKTTGIRGGECILTATNDSFCPVTAMLHHLSLNNITDPYAPLFAFRVDASWSPLTRDHFLRTTGDIYRSANLDMVLGHSYRIGGSSTYSRLVWRRSSS